MGKGRIFLSDFKELEFENFDDISVILWSLAHGWGEKINPNVNLLSLFELNCTSYDLSFS